MKVLDVLQACRAETESTHWCQGNYETMVGWFGPMDEAAIDRMPNLWRKQIESDGIEVVYKVKHCLVGMINTACLTRFDRAAGEEVDEGGYLIVDEHGHKLLQDLADVRRSTLNLLGELLYGASWDREKMQAVSGDGIEHTLEGWNDEEGRSKEEIIDLLDRAIEAEEAR
jgi:hypothetical protein